MIFFLSVERQKSAGGTPLGWTGLFGIFILGAGIFDRFY